VAGRADFEDVLSLWFELVAHHQRVDPGFQVPASLGKLLRAELSRALRSPKCRVSIAEESGAALGFVLAEVEQYRSLEAGLASGPGGGGVGWIHELYVAPHARHRGVGRELASEALAFLRDRGYARASVRVEAANPDALGFWRCLGFAERARILEGELG